MSERKAKDNTQLGAIGPEPEVNRPRSFTAGLDAARRAPQLHPSRAGQRGRGGKDEKNDNGWGGRLRSLWDAMFRDPSADENALLSSPEAIWLLGTLYSTRGFKTSKSAAHSDRVNARRPRSRDARRDVSAIRRDFYSRVWMTYRTAFPEIGRSRCTTDAGWGCMLRTTQMMLCQGFVCHYLGRRWRRSLRAAPSPRYRQLLTWFMDLPLAQCPYSIHNIVGNASIIGKRVGEWFGPQECCVMLERCHKQHQAMDSSRSDLPHIHIALNGTLCLDKLIEVCTRPPNSFAPIRMSMTTTERVLRGGVGKDAKKHRQRPRPGEKSDNARRGPDPSTLSGRALRVLIDDGVITPSAAAQRSPTKNVPKTVRKTVQGSAVPGTPTSPSSPAPAVPSDNDNSSTAGTQAKTGGLETQYLRPSRPKTHPKTHPNSNNDADLPRGTRALSTPKPIASNMADKKTAKTTLSPPRAPPPSPPGGVGTAAAGNTVKEGKEESVWEKLLHVEPGKWHSVLILVPVRLGVNKLNPRYIESLRRCLQLTNCIGFVGGKPRSSLYFVGYQNDRLVYLDPHTVQMSIPYSQRGNWSSYHCKRIRTLAFADLDPSMAIGFYCRDKVDFLNFWAAVESLNGMTYSAFRTALKTPDYSAMGGWDGDDTADAGDGDEFVEVDTPAGSTRRTKPKRGSVDEGFVLI